MHIRDVSKGNRHFISFRARKASSGASSMRGRKNRMYAEGVWELITWYVCVQGIVVPLSYDAGDSS